MAFPSTLRFPPEKLIERSLQILLENQAPSGAFIASPHFPTYAFCWFRDSSYIAYALDLYGEHEASARFHDWAASTINRRVDVVQRALQKVAAGQPLTDSDVLHTRYTLDGEENTATPWENFQLDGFGTWLWSLAEHQQHTTRSLSVECLTAARVTADYIDELWQQPCYDCWEEFGGEIHLHTLATIYGGLCAYGELTGDRRDETTQAILAFILEKGQADRHWQKFIGNTQVDTSLLALSTPYRLVAPDHPVMRNTAEKIEADLCLGGVKRYASDTYYGGGQWILLAAWLGWYWCEVGENEKAWRLRRWIEAQADERGWLAEQVPLGLNNESMYDPWVKRWGPIASPLLWSHANYLILRKFMPDDHKAVKFSPFE
jgi:GH15 family glucan-1,4-alpha-glucosidase